MATHRRLVKKKGPDFYPTPLWGTEALLAYEKFNGPILEPCCGDGAMADVLKNHGYKVLASDLYDHGYGTQRDFYDYDITDNMPNIVTNPPYREAEKMIHHALQISKKGKVCFLLRLAFLEGQGRYHRLWRQYMPRRVYVFSERLSMFPKGSLETSGGTTAYAWFVWETGKPDLSPPHIHWIAPGFKDQNYEQRF